MIGVLRTNQVRIKITYFEKINFEQNTHEQKALREKVLHFSSTLIKKALYEENYNQIGRLPKFYS